MRALATSDVPLERLRELSRDLSPDFELEVDEHQVVLMSAGPPSWVTFLANADWLIKGLAASAALYVAEIIKEAAKETWRNRDKALAAGVAASKGITRLANSIANFRQSLSPRTKVLIGLPIPDDYFGTTLELIGLDPIDLELQIALFVHHLPALTALIRSESLEHGRVLGGVHLKLLQDSTLEVSWMDRDSFEQHRRVLPLEDMA